MRKHKIHTWLALSLLAILSACGAVGIGPGYSDFGADLGQGYRLVQCSSHIVMISTSHSGKGVEAKVVSCGSDDHFIIAKQQLMDAKQRNPIPGKYQCWIIDAHAQKRFGPFTEGEFNAQRKALGVSEKITLRGTDSYRP